MNLGPLDTAILFAYLAVMVGLMVLRHQSPYDEMIGFSAPPVDNTLEVPIGGELYAAAPAPTDQRH